MGLEIEGVLHKKFDTTSVGKNNFKKREFVIETEDKYAPYVKMELVGDKCSVLDNKKEGQKIKVFFNLKGREWEGKYFSSIEAWRIEDANYKPKGKNQGSDEDYDDYQGCSDFDDDEDGLPF